MAKKILEVIFKGTDNLSGVSSTVGESMKKIGGLSIKMAGGIVAGGVAVAKLSGDLAKQGVQFSQSEQTFKNITEAMDLDYTDTLEKMRESTSGMVDDQALFLAGNKFLAMGLSETGDETANLLEMSTQLGMAMGMDATTAAGDFAAMLANQSIPRLDNFGISSGNVRTKIDELMNSNKDMTREEAFMIAVMEEGEKAMMKVGDQAESDAGKFAQFETTMSNLKSSLGVQLIPILTSLASILTPLIQEVGPKLGEIFGTFAETLSGSVIPSLAPLITELLPQILSLAEPLMTAFSSISGVLVEVLAPAFVGIVTTLLPLVSDILPPILEIFGGLVGLFAEKLLPAILPFVSSILPPLISFIAEIGEMFAISIMPLLENILAALMPFISAVLPILMDVLREIFGFANEYIVPVLNFMVNVLKVALPVAFRIFAGIWYGVLKPVLQGLKEFLDKIIGAFNGIIEAIKKVVNWFGDLIEGIKNIKLPDWLTPGSPTPFEIGLRGIADALDNVNGVGFKAFNTIPGTPGMISSGGRMGGGVVININSFLPPNDPEEVKRMLKPAIVSLFREQKALRGG